MAIKTITADETGAQSLTDINANNVDLDTRKSNKATTPTVGNFKQFDANGDDHDYGWNPALFVPASLTVKGKALSGNITLTPGDIGTTKSDVGLGNVDNTSDATKNAASVSLTNKTIDGTLNTITNTTGVMLYAVGSSSAPVDTAFYWVGAPCGVSASGNPPDGWYMFRLYVPKTGKIKAFYLTVSNFGTLGSGETGVITYYKNDTNIADIFTGVATNAVGFAAQSTGLSYAVTAGDYIYFQYKSPTWATNPTNVRWAVQAYIE